MPTPKKVLIIDDDPDYRGFCRSVLEAEGHAVITAATEDSGITLAETEKPDLIILDLMMERIDSGFRVAKRLGATFPIIMSSSATNPSDAVFDPKDLPIRQLLNKPLNGATLLEAVRKILGT